MYPSKRHRMLGSPSEQEKVVIDAVKAGNALIDKLDAHNDKIKTFFFGKYSIDRKGGPFQLEILIPNIQW